MLSKPIQVLFVCLVLIFFAACGKKAENPQAPAAKTEAQAAAANDAGVKIIDEILAVFDQCVAQAAALANQRTKKAPPCGGALSSHRLTPAEC